MAKTIAIFSFHEGEVFLQRKFPEDLFSPYEHLWVNTKRIVFSVLQLGEFRKTEVVISQMLDELVVSLELFIFSWGFL